MYRVATLKATGELLEMQSGGESDNPDLMDARLNTLLQNAINAGFTTDEIIVQWMTDAEWDSMSQKISDSAKAKSITVDTSEIENAKDLDSLKTAIIDYIKLRK